MALEARRADLERRIRVASSRQVLVPIAERELGLHEPGGLRVRAVRRCPPPVRRSADGQADAPGSPPSSSASRVGILAVLTRAAQLQIVDARALGARRRAATSARRRWCCPARRGALYDRNGVPLAITQEFYHVGVAPNELDDVRRGFRPAGAESRRLGAGARSRVPGAEARGSTCTAPSTRRRCSRCGGATAFTSTGEFQRFYPSRDLARPIIGGLAPDAPVGAAGPRAVAGLAADRPAGRGGVAQGPGGAALRFARPEDPRPGRRERRGADARRGAAGDRRAGPGRRDRPDGGRRRRRRLPRPQHGRAAGAGVAAGDAAGGAAARRPSPTRSSRARPPSCSPRPRCSCAIG